MSMGLEMTPDETAYRCNVVTLSDDEDYDNKIMLDHSADEITTEEADDSDNALADSGNAEKIITKTKTKPNFFIIIPSNQ